MVNLSDIQELNRKELLRCLRKFDSPISLIWDPNLTAPFTLFSDVKLLQEYGVEKMVALPESGRLAGFQTKYAVFLCSDTVSIIERVANVTPAQSNTEYHLIIVPKISVINKKLLREKTGYNS
ncbi:Oidioi.mRNA.OKI2018_I69.PAR.g12441.t1.cds [Oikopleura dioica]|uniref:Oidioi.mRNA.OKI2018_I69.PAR.g12441.t1.cds n=1 Tax=Oikopleura dioica TaxID=34765 RepID=A0ABN7S057_OIKDI|nr:Oidioi.mRNA.OKI2018_I69.PAR.g12441.t1.cds [Oikopleura dioica]